MATLSVRVLNGGPVAELACNGCGNWYAENIPIAALGVIGAFVTRATPPVTLQVEGLYFGPCCAERARKAMKRSNATLTAKGKRHGKP